MVIELTNRQTKAILWETEVCKITPRIFRKVIMEMYDQTANVRENRRLMVTVFKKGKEIIRLLSTDEADRFVVWVSRDNGRDIREVWEKAKY